MRWNACRKNMTTEELIEHKRVLKQQSNKTDDKKRKLNNYQMIYSNKTNTNTTTTTNTTTNTTNNDDINDYGLLHGLYELYTYSNNDEELKDVEQLIHTYEDKLNIPLEERFIYNIYNNTDYDSDNNN